MLADVDECARDATRARLLKHTETFVEIDSFQHIRLILRGAQKQLAIGLIIFDDE